MILLLKLKSLESDSAFAMESALRSYGQPLWLPYCGCLFMAAIFWLPIYGRHKIALLLPDLDTHKGCPYAIIAIQFVNPGIENIIVACRFYIFKYSSNFPLSSAAIAFFNSLLIFTLFFASFEYAIINLTAFNLMLF